jgi:hypothetical protein
LCRSSRRTRLQALLGGVIVCYRIIVKSGKEMQLFFDNPARFADYSATITTPAEVTF